MRTAEKKIALASMALIIFSFLLGKSLAIDFKQHDRFNENLRQLKDIDANLNNGVFELRYGLTSHYDGFVKSFLQIKELQNDLKRTPSFLNDRGRSEILRILDESANLQAEKERLIEKFKSENAVLKNSLYYFPVLITELAGQASRKGYGELAALLNDMLRDVLIYNLTASEDLAPKINGQIDRLLEKREDYSLAVSGSDLDMAIAHAKVILQKKPQVDALLEKLVSLPTSERSESLYRAYNHCYEKSLKTVGIYRFLLYLFSTVLLAVISAYIIIKLRKAGQAVSAAKEKLQEALSATQEAEEKYRSIFENSTDGIFQTTREEKYLSANPTLASIYGYSSPAELMASITEIGKQLYADPNRRAEFIAAVEQHNAVVQFESQVYRKDGSIIWISESARAVRDARGNLLYCEGTVEDITHRKQMEAVLLASETRLRMQQAALMELARCQPLHTGDLSAALREIAETGAYTLGVERASVWLYSDDRQSLRCAELYELTANRHSAGVGLSAKDYPSYFQAMQTDCTISAHDAHTDPRTREFSASYLTPLGISSVLDVTLRLGGRTVGVLCLEQVGPPRQWALEEENFAGYLAYMATLAMEACQRKQAQEALRQERENAERLLLNILPEPIADRLKHDTGSIADSFEDVTVLFADIVGFTELSATITPTELVGLLNQIFSRFDRLAEKHALEKIKTIGDAYMVVGGLPVPRKDHAEAVAEMAIDMHEEIRRLSAETGQTFHIRVGINTGPVVAGVIGLKKFIYDLWGDTVNTASRMESHGIPGGIQVTDTTYQLLRHKYEFQKRGAIKVKGKGEMVTYLLTGMATSKVR
uniref:adenylate/guanylate cyclase domain-containing protein n=1 Tax=Kamptonema formosum TaxID=331992 RepID=UPI000344FDBC|nr:adenylate/guanylate cyclase domain-containing protein [Oscillatoria sp. PCC 10802]